MTHILKYIGAWFTTALLSGAVLFMMNGGTGTLNPALERKGSENCQTSGDGFSGNGMEECLASLQRTLERTASDARSDLLNWHGATALFVLLVGLVFMVKIVLRDRTAGTPGDYRSLRGDWFVCLGMVIAVSLISGLVARSSFFGAWAGTLSAGRGWGIPAVMTIIWAATYWAGTRFGTPNKMQASIPGS